jgi:transaldolase
MENRLKIKLYADGANLQEMLDMASNANISGLTTNPTLMKKAGVVDYKRFAREVLEQISSKPISFEVFSDDFGSMVKQAKEISTWGSNVFVKIPITNTSGELTTSVIRELSCEGIKLNVTAVMTNEQIEQVVEVIDINVPYNLSIFAGRIADTGIDPVHTIDYAVKALEKNANAEVIWASPRELLNVIQAENCGCQIITATTDVLRKIPLIGKDLKEYSRETVQMFYNDALEAGYEI